MSVKIVIAGPPQSGKSCLRAAIHQEMLERQLPFYPITVNPDGEGSWYLKSHQANPELAKQYKAHHKQSWDDFSQERVNKYCEDVKFCQQPIVAVDIGGKITEGNRQICSYATHAILIAGDTDDADWAKRLLPWHQFAIDCELQVIAELKSDYTATADQVDGVDSGILRATIHHLDRNDALKDRPAINALCDHILSISMGFGLNVNHRSDC